MKVPEELIDYARRLAGNYIGFYTEAELREKIKSIESIIAGYQKDIAALERDLELMSSRKLLMTEFLESIGEPLTKQEPSCQ